MPPPSEDEIASLFAQHRGGDAAFGRFKSAGQLDNTATWQDARGYTLSDRVWLAGKQTTSGIDDVLSKAVLSGTDSLQVAKQLEQYLSPAFSPIRGPTGRLVRGQAAGIVTRTPGRAGAGSYAARRLARTEISRAHGLATIGVAERNPFSVGVKWNLSAAHSEPDECNTKASRDTGLGRGVYPKGSAPGYPLHPHEMCYLSSATNTKPDAVVAELRKKYGLDAARVTQTADAPLAWRPSMSRADAQLWATQGDLRRPLYHVTSPEGAAGIRTEGFDLDRIQWGRAWGDGAYMSDTIESERMYSAAFANPTKVELRVFSRKTVNVNLSANEPYIYHARHDRIWEGVARDGYSFEEVKATYLRNKRDIDVHNNTIVDDIIDANGGIDNLDDNAYQDALTTDIRLIRNPEGKALTQTLRDDYGYDAMDISEPHPTDAIGGGQVIVFDPKRVVAVTED